VDLRRSKQISYPFCDWKDQLEWLERQKANLPTLHITANLTDGEFVEYYDKLASSHEAKAWFGMNQFHRNVQHLTAFGFKPRNVEWLVDHEKIS
jgi:hypothetical protein